MREMRMRMRYYGMANLLAEVSRRLAHVSACYGSPVTPSDEAGEELMERIGDALLNACDNETFELWGNLGEGFSMNLRRLKT